MSTCSGISTKCSYEFQPGCLLLTKEILYNLARVQFSLKENKEHLMSRVKNKSSGFLNRLFIYNYLKLWKASLKPAATLDMSWQAKKTNPNPVIGNNKEQGWELAQQLRTLAAFSEGWSLVSSSHIRYLIITLYTSSKKSNLLFWLLGTSLHMFIYTHTYTCTHKPTHTWTNNVKKERKRKNMRAMCLLSAPWSQCDLPTLRVSSVCIDFVEGLWFFSLDWHPPADFCTV